MNVSDWVPVAIAVLSVAVGYGALKQEVKAIHKRVDDIHGEVKWIVHSMVEEKKNA